MEEEIEHLKELKEELSYILDKTNLASETHLNYHRKVMAIEFLLNELERLQKDNEALEYQLKCLHAENNNITRELLARTDELNKLLEENKVLKEHFDISDHECFRLEQKEIKLEKEIEQLKKENEELKCKYAKDGRVLFTIEAINERYIPKIRIRDKIEELEKELKEYDLEEYCLYEDTIQERIKIYKELLGG